MSSRPRAVRYDSHTGDDLEKAENDTPLERYFKVLEIIAVASSGLSVSEIAESCGFPVGTAHRLVQNLQQAGLIVTGGGKRKDYQLGQRLLRLLHAGMDSVRLAIAVQPILDNLADQLSDTCYLGRLVGHEVMSIAWAAPRDGLRGYVIPGHKLAPHVSASAKAIFAFQSKEIIDKALCGPLRKLADNTKTKRKDIEKEYESVRAKNYATCWNEMENGLGAIAIPIPLPTVGVVFSVGTAGLIDRLKRRSETKSVEILRTAVDGLSRALRSSV